MRKARELEEWSDEELREEWRREIIRHIRLARTEISELRQIWWWRHLPFVIAAAACVALAVWKALG